MVVWKIELSPENEPQPICYRLPDDTHPVTQPPLNAEVAQPIVLTREDRKGTAFNEPMHSHAFIEMEYIVGGSCTQNINGKEYHVKKGDVLFFDVGDKHSYHDCNNVQLVNCMFYSDLFESLIPASEATRRSAAILPNIIHLSGEYILEFEGILAKMEEEYAKKAYGYHDILKSYVSILLSLLLRFTNQSLLDVDQTTSAILEYLDEHYQDCHLEDVAQHFNFSTSYFSRYFKKNVGTTFSQYVRTKRLKEAVRLLTTTNLTIETICTQIGFSSKNQFYKLFQEHIGSTPRDVRKKRSMPKSGISD